MIHKTMHIKTLFNTLLFICVTTAIQAQNISKQVIGSVGTTLLSTNKTLSFTVGEVVVGGFIDTQVSLQLGNGYYPSLTQSTLSNAMPDTKLKVKIYPNPFTNLVYITHPEFTNFNVTVIDALGKVVLKTKHELSAPLVLKDLSQGIYYMTITTQDFNYTNTYKIIKQ